MPVATLKTQKRALADSTKAHANPKATLPSPSATKRRKVDTGSSPSKRLKVSQNGPKIGSSQPKSQFEEEVLEKLTQDISGLKQQNSEKDQQWERPGLGDFDEGNDALVFQQIEAEEGTLNGGKTTVKLFGVTEVKSCSSQSMQVHADFCRRLATLFFFMLLTSSITYMLRRQSLSRKRIRKATRRIWKLSWININLLYNPSRW